MISKLPPKGLPPGVSNFPGATKPTAMPVEQYFRRAAVPAPGEIRVVKPEEFLIALVNKVRKGAPNADVAPPTKHIISGKGGKAGGGKKGKK